MYENETLSVAIYLYNRFNDIESNLIFGENLGEHIFNKWINCNKNMIFFVCELDTNNYQKLIDRVCSIYNGRELR